MGKTFKAPDGRSYLVDKEGNVLEIDGKKVKNDPPPMPRKPKKEDG